MATSEPYSFKAVVDEVKLQSQILEEKRKYTLEEMIKRNLLTGSKQPKS